MCEQGEKDMIDDKTTKNAKHTAAGIPTWSPTVVLICRSTAYVWQSGRDAQFSADCGRMCLSCKFYRRYTSAQAFLHIDDRHQTLSTLGRSRHPTPPSPHRYVLEYQPSSSNHARIDQFSVHNHQPRLRMTVEE
jgi:hypothetical protein